MNQNQTRKFYKEINIIWMDGDIISENEEILQRWQEYFQKPTEDPQNQSNATWYHCTIHIKSNITLFKLALIST
jgi:hypothetical protein